MKRFDPGELPQRRVYSISELVGEIRFELEKNFRGLWVQGEISNFSRAASGHCYFTLKDENSQIKTVCFRTPASYLRFEPQNGLDVVARGSVTVYPPRGDFQLIVESMEPLGPGALRLAFEELKRKLQREGLFETARKRPLPRLPSRVGVVTSAGGAAIEDILRVLKRRNDRLNVLIYPSRVQGPGASIEIARGIGYLSRRDDVDVIIVTRGGGSLEDLWAFNEEVVARAIVASRKPVISAVGHEIDVTIADYVADLRAPTPSAAAEMVSDARWELMERLQHLRKRCVQSMLLLLHSRRSRLARLASSRAFVDAETRLRYYAQRLDDLGGRLERTLPGYLPPLRMRLQVKMEQFGQQLSRFQDVRRQRLGELTNRLVAISPMAVLDRGYAIVTDSNQNIVDSADQVATGELVQIRVRRGSFGARKEE